MVRAVGCGQGSCREAELHWQHTTSGLRTLVPPVLLCGGSRPVPDSDTPLTPPSLQAVDLDVVLLDKKIDQMMPELGFKAEDNDRLVASFSGGWQMRMCLGKMLLQVRGGGGRGGGCRGQD